MLKRGHAAAAMIAAVLFLASLAAAQATKVVELTADPSASLLLENEYVRVWRIVIPPQKSSALHRHQTDYVRIALSHSRFTILNEQGMGGLTFDWPQGSARFLSAEPAHRITNVGTSETMQVLEVEVLRGRLRAEHPFSPAAVESMAFDAFREPLEPEKSFHITHLTPALVGAHDQLTPGDSTEAHEHVGPHLVVPITDLELRSQPSSGEPQMLRASAGDVQWVPAGVKHKLTNVRGKPARWISLEFK